MSTTTRGYLTCVIHITNRSLVRINIKTQRGLDTEKAAEKTRATKATIRVTRRDKSKKMEKALIQQSTISDTRYPFQMQKWVNKIKISNPFSQILLLGMTNIATILPLFPCLDRWKFFPSLSSHKRCICTRP